MNVIFERLQLAFPNEAKRSFKAALIIINAAHLIPASYIRPLPPPCTSEERLDFICFVLNKETGIEYTCNEVLTAHNVLMGNHNTQVELTFDYNIEKMNQYLDEYKNLQPQSGFAKSFTLISLLPYRTTCTLCYEQLKTIFHGAGSIIYCTKIQPCLLYKADCHRCHRSYRVSSIYSIDRKETLITTDSQKADYIHYSGSLVFAKELLIAFSSQLIDNYVTFEGFASATAKMLRRLYPDLVDIVTIDTLARNLQSVWLYYELTNFIFMTSKLKEISYPYAIAESRTKVKYNQSSRAIFIERNLNWIYHIFTVFWSNHEDIFGSCKCGHCSRVIILDGHQKPRRLVCKYDNVTSLVNINELGPLNKGCPYMPQRRQSDKRESNDGGYYYCDHHRMKYTEEQSMNSKFSDEELGNYLSYLKKLDQEESQCNVGRNDIEERFETKKRSMGFIASFLNCGIIIGFSDSVNHEGPRKITDHLLTMLKLGAKIPSLLVYDAACQLYKFWQYRFNGEYLQKTKYTQQLMKMKLVTDRFHNTVHKGKLCKTIFNPDSEQNKIDFVGINTSLAEQTFSYLTNFKLALRSFAYPTSALFTILLFHLKNCDKLNEDPAQVGLIIGTHLENKIEDQSMHQTYCVFETLLLEESNKDDNPDNDDYVDLSDHDDNND
ncbi:unnamed protein product [Adineta ricciae]|uniref:CxC5 like cysteine cluster associated with KDZ domain-containing protein n=2 Tax=Adineta ricciae TaxID=249248 RepID=A0A815LNU7_ADIRI|nr:unnamed protein product [Adineta ricciae]